MLTSGQYKTLLLQRLRRFFRFDGASGDTAIQYRRDTIDLYRKLMTHKGIELEERTYRPFVETMDYLSNDCSKRGLLTLNDIYNGGPLDDYLARVQSNFADIGITLTRHDDSVITFTFADGESLSFSNWDPVGISVRTTMDYHYGLQMSPYYVIEEREDTPELEDYISSLGVSSVATYSLRPPTYALTVEWEYLSDSKTLLLSGADTMPKAAHVLLVAERDHCPVETLVIQSEITKFPLASLDYPNITLVYLAGETNPVQFSSPVTQAINLTIYTDNQAFRSFSWPKDVTITWKPLADWKE